VVPAIIIILRGRLMTVRLIWAIISNLLEEAALVVIVLWGLPELGINIPLVGLISLMVVWGIISVIIYQLGSRALRRRTLAGLPIMVGTEGQVVSALAPKGLVRIKGELWKAMSSGVNIEAGEDVIVVGQDGLGLIVDKPGSDKSKETM
jgi:membrane-bound ClpP family serine protease